MVKATKKTANKPIKSRGRQSDFSGEKKAYLEGLAKDFINSKDRSAFYDESAQGLIDKFGYSRDGKVYVEADTLTEEEKLKYYQALRNKLGQWFRHRYLGKSSDRTYVAEIVNSIKSAASLQPRKRSAVSMYMEKNKEKLTSEFAIQWSAVQNDLSQKKRLPKYTEFIQTCWKKETQSYRDEMERDVQEEHDNAIREWKEKIETFNGTPEDFERAWGMAENVLPSFADGFADWLGAHVIIVAVSPNPSNGEITIQSVQSDCSKGQVKKLLPQFDENGWKNLQEMVLTYGKAFFSPEECARRITKTENDDPDVEIGGTVSDESKNDADSSSKNNSKNDATVCDDSDESNNAADSSNKNDDADLESGLDAHDALDVDKDDPKELPKDINEESADGVIAALQVPVPDDKSSAETAETDPTTDINGGNLPPSSGSSSGLPCLPSPTVPTTDINGGNVLYPGPTLPTPISSPITPTTPTTVTEINGENANLFSLPSSLHPAGFNFPEEAPPIHGTRDLNSTFHLYSNLNNFGFTNNTFSPHSATPSHGTHVMNSTPYSSDFSLTNNTFPAHSATPPSMDFWFGNAEYTHSGSTFSQDTGGFPLGSFLNTLYEPPLVPSRNYTLPGPLLIGHTSIGMPSQSIAAPVIQPEGSMPAAFTPLPLEQHPIHAISESSSFGPATLPPAVNTSVQESTEMSDEGSNTSRGRKRKGDEVIANMAKSAKIARSNGVENVHELTGEGGESVNERAGRPTMSGRVPLMPTHLAEREGGYQGEKKGVRARKVQLTKKPKSKGNATKPVSKGAAKMPAAKKKVK